MPLIYYIITLPNNRLIKVPLKSIYQMPILF